MNQKTIVIGLFTVAGALLAALLVHLGMRKMSAKPEQPLLAEASAETAESTTSTTAATGSAMPSASASVAPLVARTIQEAIVEAGAGDSDGEKSHPAVSRVMTWSKSHTSWSTFFPGPSEVRPAVAEKDIASARGKKLCGSGRVVDIFVAQDGSGRSSGLVRDRSQAAIIIASAFPSGDLVKGSLARFCGFVIGRHTFPNTSGGKTLSIEIVGMYDLPETRPKGEPQPAL